MHHDRNMKVYAVALNVLMLLLPICADDMDGFVPGYSAEQIFIPSDCTHRAREGDYIYQHYVGTLDDGTQFGSTYESGNTYNFHLGVGEVIKGMDMGMKGMCKGEKRKITIPPKLAYGDREIGPIPADSTLTFVVELADISPSGFKIELLHMPENCTRRSAAGDYIKEHYNGTFTNGTPFDSSYDRNQTYDFTLGEGQVIKGVDLGLLNMCEGERRRLTIPPILAYGTGGYGDIIPPNSTIVFDAELVNILKGQLRWYKIDGPECTEEEAVAQHDTITILYNGFTDSGFKFSSGEEPFTFVVGERGILNGLSYGVVGMCTDGRRRMRIPPELVIGDINGVGIPENIRLTLDIELIDINKEDLFKIIDSNKDKYLTMKEVEEWITSNPDFAEKIKEKDDEVAKLKAFYFTKRDLNTDDWVSRNEFYGTKEHDEL